MAAKFKPHHPEHYPVGWLSAAKVAAAARDHEDERKRWISVDWARGEAGAVGRMKRLRAFRDGLDANKYLYPVIAAAAEAGYELTFRKVLVRGVWDVQLSWRQSRGREEMLSVARVALGCEDIPSTA